MHGIFLSTILCHRDGSVVRSLGTHRIASHLRNNGYDIQVIDFIHLIPQEDLHKFLNKFITPETKFIGLGFMADYRHPRLQSYVPRIVDLFKNLKDRYPNIKFIVGGSTSFIWSKRFANRLLFDYVIKGYGENQTLALFDHYYKGTLHPGFELADGNKHLPEHLTPNTFDFARSSHQWHKRDCIQPGEALSIEFARGCIFKCAFCRYPHIGKSKNDFTKHIDCIREELIYNYENFGTTRYTVTDDTFNADSDFVEAFTNMSKSLPFKLEYSTFLRADLLHAHPEQEDMFLENGLVGTFFGIESFQEDNAKMIGKPWSSKHGKEYLPYIYHDKWKTKINVTAGLIAGLPYETFEDYKKINEWFIENKMPSWMWHPLHIHHPNDGNYYKSDFDLNAEKYGFKFKIVEGQPIWYNDKCDQLMVYDWVDELVNDIKPFSGPPWWFLIEYSTYGLDPTTVGKSKWHEIDFNHINEECKRFMIGYCKALGAL